MVGYSNKPFTEKLGLKTGMNCAFFLSEQFPVIGYPPAGFTNQKNNKNLDFLHFFTQSKTKLEEKFPKLKSRIHKNGTLWISWPKGASKVKTDLNENIVMKIGLNNGLVDVKVVAIDNIWSGLKFVYRLKDRH